LKNRVTLNFGSGLRAELSPPHSSFPRFGGGRVSTGGLYGVAKASFGNGRAAAASGLTTSSNICSL
jgi:hypothetical protein